MAALTRSRISRLATNSAVLLICDVQERFRTLIHNSETVVSKCSFLNDAVRLFDIPIIITEQYPEKLGKTVPDIAMHPGTKVYSKEQFSMITPEVQAELEALGRKQVILCGIESHVCVLQSALDLLESGFEVHLATDAASSMRAYDRTVALQRMLASGVTMTTTESLVFDLMKTKAHPKFKEISAMLKDHNKSGTNEFAASTSL